MAKIRAFQGVRPRADLAATIAALPYDVYSREEAKEVVSKNPGSFLKIDRAETQFADDFDMYSQPVYDKARDMLNEMIADGEFVKDETACYYIYALTMNGRTQTGLVGCASIDDYLNNIIKKHENTRADKELDRIRHVDTCSAQTGPIFLAYRRVDALKSILDSVKQAEPLYDFTADDGITHQVWRIDEPGMIREIASIFDGIDRIYIADGHHRAASAVKAGLKRREDNPGYTGEEEFNFFLSVLFMEEELSIYDYNRVVQDLNGYPAREFIEKVSQIFSVGEALETVYRPRRKGEIGMYLDGFWYLLEAKPEAVSDDPVAGLDVSILQDAVLAPLLGIEDPKTDDRIQFVGGIRGLEVLKDMAAKTGGVAFAMYPTSMDELFAVADAGLLMPPKSTWFEPKLRSGIFIHQIEGDR